MVLPTCEAPYVVVVVLVDRREALLACFDETATTLVLLLTCYNCRLITF
jgi:hypothetical protein